ncbi:MAG: SDR family NAD(P)-dependent oxidoreductase [Pseudomonadota bacterium]|nr:SDR family NAD(P)-dependent oxidoreductase [Pseudomonadota bacterium]
MKLNHSLRNQTFVVTGSAEGFGYQLALKMNELGASLILIDKQLKKLKELEAKLFSDDHQKNICLAMDFLGTTYDDYYSASKIIEKNFTTIDGIIFNAAMLGSLSPLIHYEPLTWAKTFQVNVHSNFLIYKTMFTLLNPSKVTTLIFVLGPEIDDFKPNWGAYAITKKTQKAMLDLIALENHDTLVRSFGIIPQPMNTGLRRQAYPGANNDKLPPPQKNIEAILSLISSPLLYKNGQTLKVDY